MSVWIKVASRVTSLVALYHKKAFAMTPMLQHHMEFNLYVSVKEMAQRDTEILAARSKVQIIFASSL